MDFIKTKYKQRNVNHIAKYNTRHDTAQNGVKNRNEGLTIANVQLHLMLILYFAI